MKIRKGFVSNSSTSSYLISFPEKIDSKKKLEKYVKDKEEKYRFISALFDHIEKTSIDDILQHSNLSYIFNELGEIAFMSLYKTGKFSMNKEELHKLMKEHLNNHEMFINRECYIFSFDDSYVYSDEVRFVNRYIEELLTDEVKLNYERL